MLILFTGILWSVSLLFLELAILVIIHISIVLLFVGVVVSAIVDIKWQLFYLYCYSDWIVALINIQITIILNPWNYFININIQYSIDNILMCICCIILWMNIDIRKMFYGFNYQFDNYYFLICSWSLHNASNMVMVMVSFIVIDMIIYLCYCSGEGWFYSLRQFWWLLLLFLWDVNSAQSL